MTKVKHFYLMRGLIRESRHWGDFSHSLRKTFPEAKLSFLEIPGTGQYNTHSSPLHLNEIVEQTRQNHKIDPLEENILIAISLGGMVATAWASKYPEDFQKAFLINTSFKGFSPFYQRINLNHLLRIIFNPKEKTILSFVKNNPINFDQVLGEWEIIRATAPVSLENSLKQLWAAYQFSAPLVSPFKSIVLLASLNDRLVNFKCSVSIANKWGIPIEIHPTAGHDLPSDDSDWLINKIISDL